VTLRVMNVIVPIATSVCKKEVLIATELTQLTQREREGDNYYNV